jgi:hypothetical protein
MVLKRLMKDLPQKMNNWVIKVDVILPVQEK